MFPVAIIVKAVVLLAWFIIVCYAIPGGDEEIREKQR
ncbi:YoaK family small membrane protein [Serratia ureilytica]|nr:YoaK family small membrane protein [Serratia ureilytica]MCU6263615.1 YoaK family small membrane protein [Serratia ureilytica]